MKTKKITAFCLITSLLFLGGVFTFERQYQNVVAVDRTPETNPDFSKIVDANTYYNNIDITHKGDQLRTDLYNLIKGHTNYSYDRAEAAMAIVDRDWVKSPDPGDTNPWMILLYADYNDTNCQTWDKSYGGFGSTVAGQYSWDKEHMWAKSNGGFGTSAGPGSDLHHLRASDKQINNGSRGNLPYGNAPDGSYQKDIFGNTSSNKKGNGVFEPGDEWKGDCARALFYMATRYGPNDSHKLNLTTGTDSSGGKWGYLDTLLEWNELDKPDAREIKRNDMVSIFQNNRNPYIDHPEYARAVFKNETIVPQHTLVDLTVSGTCKKEYKEGETFDPTGLTITAIFDDEETLNVTNSMTWTPSTISKTTTSIAGSFTYNGVNKEIQIDGISIIEIESLELSGNATKLNYVAGESFDSTGLTVHAKYGDESLEDVTNLVSWSPNPLTAGTTKVIGSYAGLIVEYEGITVESMQNYKISFEDVVGNEELNASNILNSVSSGKEYINSFTNANKIYETTNAIKIGSGNADGQFTVNLSSKGRGQIQKIKVVAKSYSGVSTLIISTNFVTKTTGEGIAPNGYAEYVYELSGMLTTLIVSSKNRTLLKSIEIIANEEIEPDPPIIPDPPVDPEPETPTNLCGGNITMTSTIISVISLMGVCLFAYKKRKRL